MKLKIIIDRSRDEEILIVSHERTKLIEDIELLVENSVKEIAGYTEGEIRKLVLAQVCCFIIENNKVYAMAGKDKLQIKLRFYQLEEMLDSRFIKINQSCIANINEIRKFDTSITGTLKVIFKNGYSDYVSRRNIRTVKERLGVK